MTNSEVKEILTGFYNSHYNLNEYWNKGYTEDQLSSSDWGLTSTKCVKDACTSNEFGDCEQCFGFALFMAYLVFGTKINYSMIITAADGDLLPGGWRIYKNQSSINSLTLEPGDIIRDMYPYIDSKTGETKYGKHAAIVREVTGNTFRVAECWGSDPYGCQLAWEYFNGNSNNANISTVLSRAVFVLKAPKTCNSDSIVGDDVDDAVKIINIASGKCLTVSGTNLSSGNTVTMNTYSGSDGQKWIVDSQGCDIKISSYVDSDYSLGLGTSHICVVSSSDELLCLDTTQNNLVIRHSSNHTLALTASSTSEGSKARWAIYNGGTLQQWKFEAV